MVSIYARLVAVHRVKSNAGTADDTIGLAAYSGAEQGSGSAGETVLYANIPASIQAAQTGRKRDTALPQDAVFAPTWRIYIPLSALPKGAVRDRDIIVDDEGYRYEVGQAYWNILGYALVCIRLEA
jgi:hypothetical protein